MKNVYESVSIENNSLVFTIVHFIITCIPRERALRKRHKSLCSCSQLQSVQTLPHRDVRESTACDAGVRVTLPTSVGAVRLRALAPWESVRVAVGPCIDSRVLRLCGTRHSIVPNTHIRSLTPPVFTHTPQNDSRYVTDPCCTPFGGCSPYDGVIPVRYVSAISSTTA